MLMLILWLIMGDVRIYPFTYPFVTTPEGDVEIEYYHTFKDKKPDETIDTVERWLELEYGITDRLDVSIYQMWNEVGGNVKSVGNKLRFRYKLTENKNEFILDPLLYLEYKLLLDKPDETEYKLILAKDIGRFNLSYNYTLELSHSDRIGKWEHMHFLGFSYAISAYLRLLMENMYIADYEGKGESNYIGGGFQHVAGSGKFWFTLGVYRGTTNFSEHTRARLLIGIPI
ncbi:MAG: hypothetical protein NZ870_00275 [bacterium]|nr:hypothetical protein [bacterium]